MVMWLPLIVLLSLALAVAGAIAIGVIFWVILRQRPKGAFPVEVDAEVKRKL